MAAPVRKSPDPLRSTGEPPPALVADRLFADAPAFDFFQAVRLLQALEPSRVRVGHGGPPGDEAIRFRSLSSLSFPPSSIYQLSHAPQRERPPELTQAFLGLTGPNGVLPRHYTELVMHLDLERRDPERHSLRDWLDLFNHRFASLFYRAWEKYRLHLEPDRRPAHLPAAEGATGPFETSLLSLIGLGTPTLQGRLRVPFIRSGPTRPAPPRVEDQTLIFHAGLIMHQTRSACGLEAILRHYFGLQVQLQQFLGRWLHLAEPMQSRLPAGAESSNRLGINSVLGERVWDIQGFFRVRIGPLSYREFLDFLPDPTQADGTPASFLAAQLIRFYAGPELDFEIQLVLRDKEVPRCQLPIGDSVGPILGWNSWLANEPLGRDPDDAAFENSTLGV